jgi:DNA invertase Pin-like site-specific DNA recombinase
MKKKIALYCRVSSAIHQSNDNQKFILQKYARENNFDFELFEERMTTRKTRPVKADLLSKLRSGSYEAVVVYRLDRWARSTAELLMELEEFNKKNIRFISLADNLDTSSSVSTLLIGIISIFCQFERQLVSERTKLFFQRAKAEGRKFGRPPGAKDKRPRKKSGYILREATKRKTKDIQKGVNMPIESYFRS